jgi:hypothetical protein
MVTPIIARRCASGSSIGGQLRVFQARCQYSGRKITASLENVTVIGEKRWKGQGEARRPRVCLSMYSITENIYCSQLSVALLLQPEPNCFTSYSTRKGLCSLSLCAIALRSPPPSHVSTCNGQRSSQLFSVHYSSVFQFIT